MVGRGGRRECERQGGREGRIDVEGGGKLEEAGEKGRKVLDVECVWGQCSKL